MRKSEFFDNKSKEEQKKCMIDWFLNNYEDPANCCPFEDGEYQYIWGGPYEAKEVLEEHFSDFVSQEVIDEVAQELDDISYEWSDLPENDEEELNYFINNSDDPYIKFLDTKADIEELLNEKLVGKKIIYKMLYVQIISAMEQFLSSFFIVQIKDNIELCIKFINSCDELKKIKLHEFAESKKTINEYCCNYILEKIIWHKFRIVKKYYKEVLDIVFPDNIPIIYQGIEKRHHIIHRNGRDFNNNEIKITKRDVTELLNEITKFVEKIGDIRF